MSSSILVLCLLAGTSWAFVPDDPDFRGDSFIGRYPNDIFYFNRNTFVPSSDIAQQVVEKFLARMVRSLESQDVAVISGLFQPGFVFKGCKGTYDKTQIIGLLTRIPSGTQFTLTLKSVLDIGSSIKSTVLASGFGPASIEANFVLNKIDQRLESGEIPACQKSRFVIFSQPEDPNAVVQRFLTSMKPILASHEPAIIGKLFDDAFIFKGCHGTYTKAQAIAKITSLPSGASFDFSLINSKWNNLGQIEYTVYVSVPMMDRFQAQFVYCPHRNVLKSGSVPGCAASRLFNVFY
ncbi:unnamed protein product [Caenorhabditis nigoni]